MHTLNIDQLKHDNARLRAFLQEKSSIGHIPIKLGSRCMASIKHPSSTCSNGKIRVAAKLIAITGGRNNCVVRYRGKLYDVDMDGLSGVHPTYEDEENLPLDERCDWRDVYQMLARRRKSLLEPENVYTLLEKILTSPI